MNVDVRFINVETEATTGKSCGRYFIAFSPFPKGIRSKAKWIGLAPENEAVARTLAKWFTEIADQYAKERAQAEKAQKKP